MREERWDNVWSAVCVDLQPGGCEPLPATALWGFWGERAGLGLKAIWHWKCHIKIISELRDEVGYTLSAQVNRKIDFDHFVLSDELLTLWPLTLTKRPCLLRQCLFRATFLKWWSTSLKLRRCPFMNNIKKITFNYLSKWKRNLKSVICAAAETTTPQSPLFLHERRTTKRWAAMSCSSCERECVESREGKENNLMAWNSVAADLQPNTKHTPGSVERRKSCDPHRDPITLWAPWGSLPLDCWPMSTQNTKSHHYSPPQHNYYLHCAGWPQLAKYTRFNWHTEQKLLRTVWKWVSHTHSIIKLQPQQVRFYGWSVSQHLAVWLLLLNFTSLLLLKKKSLRQSQCYKTIG